MVAIIPFEGKKVLMKNIIAMKFERLSKPIADEKVEEIASNLKAKLGNRVFIP